VARHGEKRFLAVDVAEDNARDGLGHHPVEPGFALELYEINPSSEESFCNGGKSRGGPPSLSVARSNCVQRISVRSTSFDSLGEGFRQSLAGVSVLLGCGSMVNSIA